MPVQCNTLSLPGRYLLVPRPLARANLNILVFFINHTIKNGMKDPYFSCFLLKQALKTGRLPNKYTFWLAR